MLYYVLTFYIKCVNLLHLKRKLKIVKLYDVMVLRSLIENSSGWIILILILIAVLWTLYNMKKNKPSEYVYKEPIRDPSLVVASISESNDLNFVSNSLSRLLELAQELEKRKNKTPFYYLVYQVLNTNYNLQDDQLIDDILESFRRFTDSDSEDVGYSEVVRMMTTGQPLVWTQIFTG